MNVRLRELFLAASMTGASTAVVGAQPAVPAAPTNAPGPRIQFDSTLFDFGRVKSGEAVKHTYVFTNTGDTLLVINSVQPQCACSAAGEWTKQVEPGKTGVIPIQFNTLGYGGQVFKQTTVTCNVTNQPMLFLQLKGTVYKPYDVIPALAILNVAPDAETASVVMTITNNTEEPLEVFSPQSNNRTFSAQLATNQPGKGYQLTVSTVPPLPTGSVQGQITVKTSWTNTPVIPVTVVVNAQPPVMVMPAYITLAPGPLPNAVTNSIAIQNNSTNSLRLSDPAVNVADVQVQIKETQPGRSFAAMLAFPKGFQIPPGQQVELSVKTSHPKVPLVKVPVMQLPRQPMQVLPAPPAPATAATPVLAPPAPAVAPATPAKAAPVRTVRTIRRPPPELPPEPPDPPARSK